MNDTCYRPFRSIATALWSILLGGVLATPFMVSGNDPGDFLVRNSVRVALLFWAIAVALMIRHFPSRRTIRLLWSLAWGAFIVHVALAFEYFHHWSHTAALRHVKEASGFGPGLFVSYLFTLLWTADVAWWWTAPDSHERRPRWLERAGFWFMIFIIFNGAIIYASGAIRWVGAMVFLGLLALWASNQAASGEQAGNSPPVA